MALEQHEVFSIIRQIESSIEGIAYRGIPVFGLIKIPFFLIHKRNTSYKNFVNSIVFKVSSVVSTISNILFILFGEKKGFQLTFSGEADRIFVLDHDRKELIDMEIEVIKHFREESIIIITQSRHIYKQLKDRYKYVYCSSELIRGAKVTGEQAKLLRGFYRALKPVRTDFFLKLELTGLLMVYLQYIDLYNHLLQKEIKSVMTLCDAHAHEHAITCVARLKGIDTFTLQHGEVGPLYVPVESDKIFVWGEMAKKELLALNVPDEKISVFGNPILSDRVRKYLPKKDEVRKGFSRRHGLDASKLVVSYFATNWGMDENYRLFETFCSVLDLDIAPVIKLRPLLDEFQLKFYTEWLETLVPDRAVPVLINDDPYEIFAASDIIVTFHSGAAVEAMPFGTSAILLDIFDHINLRSLPHYDDCLAVNNRVELRALLRELMEDRDYLRALQAESFSKHIKYFGPLLKEDTSLRIARSMKGHEEVSG